MFYTCAVCGDRVEADDPATVKARELIRTPDASGGDESIEGEGFMFHEGCWPKRNSQRQYRRVSES